MCVNTLDSVYSKSVCRCDCQEKYISKCIAVGKGCKRKGTSEFDCVFVTPSGFIIIAFLEHSGVKSSQKCMGPLSFPGGIKMKCVSLLFAKAFDMRAPIDVVNLYPVCTVCLCLCT